MIDARIDTLIGAKELTTIERRKVQDEFVALTDGMTLVELFGIFLYVSRRNIRYFKFVTL